MKTNMITSIAAAIVFILGGANLNVQSSEPTGNFIYNINGTLDVVRGAINLCTSPGAGADATQSVELNIGAKGVVNCGDYIRKHVGKTGQSVKISIAPGATLTYSGTLYTTNQCADGSSDASTGISGAEVTNSLLSSGSNQNVTFSNTKDVTLIGDSSFVVKGNYVQSSNLLGKSLIMNGSATQTLNSNNKNIAGLIINNTAAGDIVLLNPLTVTGSLELQSGNMRLGAHSLIIPPGVSITGGSAASHIVTDGAGMLTQTVTTTGAAFPVGISAGSYDPAFIKPIVEKLFSVKVTEGVTGTPPAGISYNPREWTIDSEASTGVEVTLTPSVATYTENPAIGYYTEGVWTNTTTRVTLSGASYTARLNAFNRSFATGGSTTSSLETPAHPFTYRVENRQLIVKGLNVGNVLSVFNINGLQVANYAAAGDEASVALNEPGVYIVKIKSGNDVATLKIVSE